MSNEVMNKDLDLLNEPEMEFLKDLRVHMVNGKPNLGNESLPFNVTQIFTEQEFVDTWLIQFALGNVFGTNYFDHQRWGKLTNMGTLAAMVVDADGKPILIVPPLTSNNMSDRDYELLRMASFVINANEKDNFKRNDKNANLEVANKIQEHLQAKTLTITEMIPEFFYQRYQLIPEVEQQAFYIRDVINEGRVSVEDMVKVREVLYKFRRDETITSDEKEHLTAISRGEFLFGEQEVKETGDTNKNNDQLIVNSPSEPYDPLSC